MKANNVPRKERIENRIRNLETKLGYPWEPIGGGNPYMMCVGCGKSMPASTYEGHYPGCWVKGVEKEIEYYKGLLYDGPIRIC